MKEITIPFESLVSFLKEKELNNVADMLQYIRENVDCTPIVTKRFDDPSINRYPSADEFRDCIYYILYPYSTIQVTWEYHPIKERDKVAISFTCPQYDTCSLNEVNSNRRNEYTDKFTFIRERGKWVDYIKENLEIKRSEIGCQLEPIETYRDKLIKSIKQNISKFKGWS